MSKYLDGQVMQANLYAQLWIARINSGAYKLRKISHTIKFEDFDLRIHHRHPDSEIIERDGIVYMTSVELTDEEKLESACNVALTHIQRIEELSALYKEEER